jgi:hypothetical protein
MDLRENMRTVVLSAFFAADTERSIRLTIDNCLRPYMTQIMCRGPMIVDLRI